LLPSVKNDLTKIKLNKERLRPQPITAFDVGFLPGGEPGRSEAK